MLSSHRYLCSSAVKLTETSLEASRELEHRIFFISKELDEILLFKITKQQQAKTYTYKPKRFIETVFVGENGSNVLIKYKDQDELESMKVGKEGFEIEETFNLFETLGLKQTSNVLIAFHNPIQLVDPEL